MIYSIVIGDDAFPVSRSLLYMRSTAGLSEGYAYFGRTLCGCLRELLNRSCSSSHVMSGRKATEANFLGEDTCSLKDSLMDFIASPTMVYYVCPSECGRRQTINATSTSFSRPWMKYIQHAIRILMRFMGCASSFMLSIADHLLIIDQVILIYLSSCLQPRRVVGAASVDASSVPTI